VPVVLYHADLDAKANPESRKAHAWIEALRVGSMERNGKTVATLEGRFRWVNASTKSDVETGALKFGSVTIFQDALDEETGDDIGTLLYSFSLTNNPALVDLPALAAARLAGDSTALGYWYGDLDTRDDLVSCLRSIFELPVTSSEADVLAALDKLEELASSGDDAAKEAVCTLRRSLRLPLLTSVEDVIAEVRKGLSSLPSESTDTPSVDLSRGGFPAEENSPMALKLIALAAALGVVARDEDDAASQMNALATEAVDVRRALGSKTAAETAAKLSELSANAAKVPALETKLATAEAEALERAKNAREAHLTALCKARPELEAVRPSLELHARQDFASFASAYPIPAGNPEAIALQAKLEKTQQLARGTQIAPPAGTPAPAPSAMQMPVNHAALARTLATELMKNDPKLSERDALLLASKSVKNAENAAGKQ
jgi:murein DD-endopeptidase MepM/ murein hydrolase activator NlpD